MTSVTPEQLTALSPEFLAENRSHEILPGVITLIILQFITFVLYIAARTLTDVRNDWKAWFLFGCSFLSCLSVSITGLLSYSIGGLGRHVAYHLLTDPQTLTRSLQVSTAAEYLYQVSVIFPKLMIIKLYLSIFVDRTTRLCTWGLAALLALYFIASIMVGFFICDPIAFKWNKSIEGGSCGDLLSVYRYVSIPNLVTDVIIIALPIPMILKLQVNKKRKIGIALTFLMGGMGIIAAISRMVIFFAVDVFSDSTYVGIPTLMLTIAEPTAYFMCACMPSIRPLYVSVVEKSEFGYRLRSSLRSGRGARSTEPGKTTELKTYPPRVSALGQSEDRVGLAIPSAYKTSFTSFPASVHSQV